MRPGASEGAARILDREPGRSPDFVLEVASPSTGQQDYTVKRLDYERHRIAEYWRFDPSGGEYHGTALSGERLTDDGTYESIEIERLGDDVWQGYGEALGLRVCWENGLLRFYDPQTQSYLPSHEEERTGRLEERTRAESRGRSPTRGGITHRRA